MYVIVAINHFIKWIEVELAPKITFDRVIPFARKTFSLFGIPAILIIDNGKQFTRKKFKDFCLKWRIDLKFTLVYHPQSNGITKVTNKTILQGLKEHLDKAKENWEEESTIVLWAYHTTPRTSIGETPFSLTYGAEAVIPIEFQVLKTRMMQSGSPLTI